MNGGGSVVLTADWRLPIGDCRLDTADTDLRSIIHEAEFRHRKL